MMRNHITKYRFCQKSIVNFYIEGCNRVSNIKIELIVD
jgi:hypothetical protein